MRGEMEIEIAAYIFSFACRNSNIHLKIHNEYVDKFMSLWVASILPIILL
jgi:hypothetical protein